jgi:hypothetical protein
MNTIPPNNLDQLIAWIRVFAEETKSQLQNIKQDLLKLQNASKENL